MRGVYGYCFCNPGMGGIMSIFVIKLLFVCIVLVGVVIAGTAEDEARALFNRYVQLEHAFDPAAADLYAEDALIKNKRTYPHGQVRELTLPVDKYKALIRQSMPLAKLRGDTNSYSDVSFTKEGEGVRIKATRFSNLKKYSSPISLLVAPDSSGMWLIREELSESQP
jgi:hypothetical protein